MWCGEAAKLGLATCGVGLRIGVSPRGKRKKPASLAGFYDLILLRESLLVLTHFALDFRSPNGKRIDHLIQFFFQSRIMS